MPKKKGVFLAKREKNSKKQKKLISKSEGKLAKIDSKDCYKPSDNYEEKKCEEKLTKIDSKECYKPSDNYEEKKYEKIKEENNMCLIDFPFLCEFKNEKYDISMEINNFQIYSKDSYKFRVYCEKENINFKIQNIQYFPTKNYELTISLNDLQSMEDFEIFNYKNAEKFFNIIIKKCIDSDKYNIKNDNNEDSVIFELNSEIFENDFAKIKIPKKDFDLNLKTEVESLALAISEIDQKLNENEKWNEKPDNKKCKEKAAINSFEGTSFLVDNEKKLISEWIDPYKVFTFNLLYTNAKDSDSSSYFHYYCDGVYPTVTIIYDTSGRKFGGYCHKVGLNHLLVVVLQEP